MNSILLQAVEALECRDAKAFAACFSEDADFADFCPSSNGNDNWCCFGASGIEMFYTHMITDGRFAVFCPKAEDDHRISFFGLYDGPFVYALFELKEIDEKGLIKKALIYPTT